MSNDPMRGIQEAIRASQQSLNAAVSQIESKNRQKEEREIRMLQAAEQTAKNTAVLPEMLDMIRQSTENQQEVIEILSEILSFAKAKSKDEAANRYRKVMKKAAELKGDIETATKLMGYATAAWNTIEKLF
ncbi:hypothetical protein [Paenibacillus lautus]|uniref:hypothetical protein n=1 Tax=Paenibacillus lautus TaxID=1401 RepID=UPI003D2D6FA5